MSDEKDSKKILDNPSAEEMNSVLPGLKALGNVAGFLGKLGVKKEPLKAFQEKVDDLTKQANILHLPDRFNETFGAKGWIAVGGALSVEIIEEALSLHAEDKVDEAESVLVEWFTKERIELFAILRARRFHKARLRDDQLEEALQLYLEGRYIAAVPLILIACDGFASDIAPVSPFEKDADLSCFDSITGHSTALPALIKLLTKGVRKSRDDEISLPLRHGILHGRSLGYANKTVCAKAWLLMMALVDWAIDKSSEEDHQKKFDEKKSQTLADGLMRYRMVQADKKTIEAFEPHEVTGPPKEPLNSDGPELAVTSFLSGWKAKNYGKMGGVVVNMTNKPANKMAGEMRNMAEFVELIGYDIKSIRYSTVARCDVRIRARAKTLKKEVDGEFNLLLLRFTSTGEVAMPNDEDCQWAVQQNCIYNIMNEKFASDT